MKKIIIIVGGTGFLGYHLAKYFLRKKWNVVSISRKKAKKIRLLNKVKYLFVDITNKRKLKNKLKKYLNVDYVVNFGGEVEHRNLKKTFQSHFNGSKNLSEIFVNSKLKKFMQIGSSLEYGNSRSPHKENYAIQPKSNYSRAKSLASKNLISLYKTKKFPIAIIRPYQVYGPHQDFNRFIPTIINACLQNQVFPCSEGKQYRDFLFIDDFIEAVIKILKFKNTSGEIFNIGFGKAYKLKTIIKYIQKKIKFGKPKYGIIKLRKDENLITYPSIIKAKKYLDWKPKISFFTGVNKTIKYYKYKK